MCFWHPEEPESGPAETLDLWLTQMSVSSLYTKIHEWWREKGAAPPAPPAEPFKAMKCGKHESEADSLIKARLFTFGPPRRGSVIYPKSLLTHRLSERDFTFSSALRRSRTRRARTHGSEVQHGRRHQRLSEQRLLGDFTSWILTTARQGGSGSHVGLLYFL